MELEPEPLEKAQHCRDQAAHMRALADKEDNPQNRKTLIEVAETYDMLWQKFMDLAAGGAKKRS